MWAFTKSCSLTCCIERDPHFQVPPDLNVSKTALGGVLCCLGVYGPLIKELIPLNHPLTWCPAEATTCTFNRFKVETGNLRSQLREQSCIVTNTKAPECLLSNVQSSCEYAIKLLWCRVEDVCILKNQCRIVLYILSIHTRVEIKICSMP